MFDLNAYLRDLETVVNIDSNSSDPIGLNKCVDVFERLAKEQGLFVKRHHIGDYTGDYLEISNRENADHYDVIMMGHIDTVQPIDYTKEYPFHIEGELAHGPGISDMKCGTLAMLYIIKELDKEVLDNLCIGILMNCDEEISSRYSEPITRSIAKKTDIAFIMEGGKNDGGHTIKRKGTATYKIKFNGLACHAGQILVQPNANALVEMGRWAVEIYKLNNKDTGFSANCGICSSGHAGNVVPDHAELTINIRVVNKEQFDEFESNLQRLAKTPFVEGVTVEIERLAKKTPMLPAKGMDEYLERVKKVFKEKLGLDFYTKPMVGGCSDGNIIADEGVIVLDHLGPHGSGGHKRVEFLYKDEVYYCINRMTALIEEISDHKKNTLN
ncbi:MAG: M20/M25/M40 family metallo-hydrolase [Clostridia bacterium]|nr:M20/M25/M40 family metallo-hydrolase [Clostridia bacterium]